MPDVLISLRALRTDDLPALESWWQPDQEWHRCDAPYFQKPSAEQVRQSIARLAATLPEQPVDPIQQVIADDQDRLLGMTSWHWEHEPAGWARCGLTVYDPDRRGHGVGARALQLLADQIFTDTAAHRLDYLTWSGNTAMCRVGEKLGWTREATFRQAREVRGERYDSVAYGVLRSEWTQTVGAPAAR